MAEEAKLVAWLKRSSDRTCGREDCQILYGCEITDIVGSEGNI